MFITEYRGKTIHICKHHKFPGRFQFFVDLELGQDTCGQYQGYADADQAETAAIATVIQFLDSNQPTNQ